MSPVVDEQQETWVGIREAAKIVGCSHYGLQKLALSGAVRVKILPPLRAIYAKSDVEALARSFAGS